MKDLTVVMRNTVPITLFNKGLAGRVFEDVKTSGAKVVIKNNSPECVLLSPDDYSELIDELNDTRLLKETLNRLDNLDSDKLISQEAIDKEFGFSDKDLDGFEEVEFE